LLAVIAIVFMVLQLHSSMGIGLQLDVSLGVRLGAVLALGRVVGKELGCGVAAAGDVHVAPHKPPAGYS
jgi:hypothetical protein